MRSRQNDSGGMCDYYAAHTKSCWRGLTFAGFIESKAKEGKMFLGHTKLKPLRSSAMYTDFKLRPPALLKPTRRSRYLQRPPSPFAFYMSSPAAAPFEEDDPMKGSGQEEEEGDVIAGASDDSSEEPEEDEDEARRVQDGFIVDEDEEDDEEDRRRRKRRKRHHRRGKASVLQDNILH